METGTVAGPLQGRLRDRSSRHQQGIRFGVIVALLATAGGTLATSETINISSM